MAQPPRLARSSHFSLTLLLAWLVSSAFAAGTNRTIDDTYGDSATGQLPIYTPIGLWRPGQNCSTCAVQPGDPGRAFSGTWHDSTQDSSERKMHTVTVSFTGSAVYMYCILDNEIVSDVATRTELAFTLDGQDAGTFLHLPTGQDDTRGFLYDVPVYTNTSLPLGEHTLSMSIVATSESTLALFDYAVYTYETKTTPKHTVPVAAIAGFAVSIVVVVLGFMAVFLLLRRRRLRRELSGPFMIQPFRDPELTIEPQEEPKRSPITNATIAPWFAPPDAPTSPVPPRRFGSNEKISALSPTVTANTRVTFPPGLNASSSVSGFNSTLGTSVVSSPVTHEASDSFPVSPRTVLPHSARRERKLLREVDALTGEVERLRSSREATGVAGGDGVAPPAYESAR